MPPTARTGIVTLANDAVLDGLVAFLNSLEVNAPRSPPVCIIPYDDRVEGVRRELERRPGVVLYDDRDSIAVWERFARDAWRLHPTAMARWRARTGVEHVHRLAMHRKFCAFDGPFDRFLYMDADMLVFAPLDRFFDAAAASDLVPYDDQVAGLSHVYDIDSPRLHGLFSAETLASQPFCAGLFASRRGLFDASSRAEALAHLAAGDAEVLYLWAPDQSLLNYMTMRLGRSVHNLYLGAPAGGRAATCVTAPRLHERDHRLYDGVVPLPFLHYIGIPADAFGRVGRGENVVFPYREIYLHYRYLRDPGDRPALRGRRRPYHPSHGRMAKLLRRLRLRR